MGGFFSLESNKTFKYEENRRHDKGGEQVYCVDFLDFKNGETGGENQNTADNRNLTHQLRCHIWCNNASKQIN